MIGPNDPLSSNPDRLRRLADELEQEGQADLAQATRRAADAAERDRRRTSGQEGRGEDAWEPDGPACTRAAAPPPA